MQLNILLLITVIVILWLTLSCSVILVYHRQLLKLWREPMFAQPVFILESDDWGPLPQSQLRALKKLISLLSHYKDQHKRPAHMTLGILLAAPTPTWQLDEPTSVQLSDADFSELRAVIEQGCKKHVFSLHLHGWTHYELSTLHKAAKDNKQWLQWLAYCADGQHEKLPSHLQSRWVDSAQLPSRPLSASHAQAMVDQEVTAFSATFGRKPTIWVPPTFVWQERIEHMMVTQGIKAIVTPGQRLTGRAANGQPTATCAAGTQNLYNNQMLESGLKTLVRNSYFEPVQGHKAESLLQQMTEHVRQGRPTLVETHRANYIGAKAEQSFAELERLLQKVLKEFPNVGFISSEQLAFGRAMPELKRLHDRLAVYSFRLQQTPRMEKITRWLGWPYLLKLASKLSIPLALFKQRTVRT